MDHPSTPRRLAMTAVPIGTTLVMLCVVGLHDGWHVAQELVIFMVAIFVALGKFAVYASTVAQSVDPTLIKDLAAVVGCTPQDPLLSYYIAGLVTYMDICVAILVAYNIDWLYNIPVAGKRLRQMNDSSAEILEVFPWIRNATFVGCMLFVAFPLSGTGAIGGTLLGRMMGFSHRRTLTAIAIGAVGGTFGLAASAHLASANLDFLKDRLDIAVAVVGVFLAFFFWLNWVVRSKVKALRAQRALEGASA